MFELYGENWIIILAVSAVLTWTIGLTPPLLIRFLLVRKPIEQAWAVGVMALFFSVNFIASILGSIALGSTSKSHAALFLIAWASYAIMRIGAKSKIQSVVESHNLVKSDVAIGFINKEPESKPSISSYPLSVLS